MKHIFSGGFPEGNTAFKSSIFRRKFQYKTPGGCEKTEKTPGQKGPS